MKMKKLRLTAFAALALGSSVAIAGLVNEVPVTVTLNPDGSGSANGNMVSARFANNNVEYIGCGIRRFDDGFGGALVFGFCQASDAAGVVAFCQSENAALLASIGDQDDYSFVTFSWNAAGECRTIGNSTQSFYIPKK